MIVVEKKGRKRGSILRQYPEAVIFDVTSKGLMNRLSPEFAHGGVPVPFSEGRESVSVAGIWEGLKVFEGRGIDTRRFQEKDMEKLPRTEKSLGRKLLGWRKGVKSKVLLNEEEARKEIFKPAFKWVIENRLGKDVERLREMSESRTVVLLDGPLGHAELIREAVAA